MINAIYRIYKMIFMLCANFIPFKEVRRAKRDYCQKLQYKSRRFAFEDNNKFPNYLSIIACVKNEGAYLKEWIEYHRLLGVEKFYIYDNNSTDNTREVLKPYILEENGGEEGSIVVYEKCSRDESKDIQFWQRNIYTKAVRKYKKQSRWIAIIDIDEFLVPKKHNNLVEFLKEYEAFSQITIGYKLFGSCAHKTKPKGLLIENYLYCSKTPDYSGKSIVNPRSILGKTQIHYSKVIGMPVNEKKEPYLSDPSKLPSTADIIQINHYWHKSEEEFMLRPSRKGQDIPKRNQEDEVKDEAAQRFVLKLKKNL